MNSSKPHFRWAFDLGTTSIGWAVFRIKPTDENNNSFRPTALLKAGVRIFSDGRNPKDGSSLAVTRRAARAMRRRRDRLLKRKARMMNLLVHYGFFPAHAKDRKVLESYNPYDLRKEGLERALTPGEFARALFHINQRRGFKSNRKTDKADNDSGALKQAISALRQEMLEQQALLPAGQTMTIGRLLWQRKQEKLPLRARYRETPYITDDGKKRINKSYDLYIDRQMIADEFDALWTKQAEFNPELFNEEARADLRDALLFQRKLRPVQPGRCTLIPDEPRAALALPSTQRFRIYQEANNLRLLNNSDLHQTPLTKEQRDKVIDALERSNKCTFKQLHKLLGLSGTMQFNLEDAKRTELKGNSTTAILAKPEHFGSAWHQFDHVLQDEIVEQLVTEENEGKLVAWLQERTGIDAEAAYKIANVALPEGYGNLSQKALRRILPELLQCDIKDGVTCVRNIYKAVVAAGFQSHSDLGIDFDFQDDEVAFTREYVVETTGEIKHQAIFKQLPYYGRALRRHVAFAKEHPRNEEERYGKIANPTVHIGLNQLRKVVNALLRKYGHPTEIVVELARDLKQSREQRLEEMRRQADNQKKNTAIRQQIADILNISEERVRYHDIEKWRLWEELNLYNAADRCCPYSGKQISAHMLLTDQVEIEHILPFSQTLDDSRNNKTVALREANRVKGNRTPWQARDDFAQQGWLFEDIERRASVMPKAKRYRFAPDGYEQWLQTDKDFLARALNDTRYLSRIAKEYLTLICPSNGVRVIPGRMTAMLRRRLGLNDVLGLDGEKNRDDHRHHAVDACVIGITDQGMLQRFAQASASAREKGLERLVETIDPPWNTYANHVQRAVEHIWVSHKPDHGHEAAMMEETTYGIAKDGSVIQRRKADGSMGREITNVIKITEPSQPERHGVDEHGNPLPYKGYLGGSNYCLEITCNEKGKWEGTVISTYQAYQIAKEFGVGRLHDPLFANSLDAAGARLPLVMRLIRGDTVSMVVNKQVQIMRVVQISGIGQMIFAPIQEANVDARNRDKTDPFAYTTKYAGSLQKASGRKVHISPIGELKDPGFKG